VVQDETHGPMPLTLARARTDGPVDGQWTPALTDALKKFQAELGVPATGTVDAATIAALEKAIAEAKKPPSSPTSRPAPTADTATPTPKQS
jgi:peptidoglycan hydrolase-like protein with peptidoglycan-binding domain